MRRPVRLLISTAVIFASACSSSDNSGGSSGGTGTSGNTGSSSGTYSGTNSGTGSGSGSSTGTGTGSTGTGSGNTTGSSGTSGSSSGASGASTGTGSGTTAGSSGSTTGTGSGSTTGSTAGTKSGSTTGSTTGTTAGTKSGTGTGGTTGTSGTATASDSGTSGSGSDYDGGDPCSDTTMPTGGTAHMSANAQGMADGLAWTIWSNGSAGSITTFDNAEAFSATWNNSGDYLARLGMNWQNNKTYTQLGTITAEFNETKTGTGGGYSYIGIYGWSVSPCVEFYIVEDSYNKMPVNPGNTTNNGTVMIDGGSYTLYSRPTTGTGGSNCPGVSSWTQFYSVRQTARTCGTISVTQHFAAWAAAGMALGNMNQAQVLVEVGGGSGSINFSVASMNVSM